MLLRPQLRKRAGRHCDGTARIGSCQAPPTLSSPLWEQTCKSRPVPTKTRRILAAANRGRGRRRQPHHAR